MIKIAAFGDITGTCMPVMPWVVHRILAVSNWFSNGSIPRFDVSTIRFSFNFCLLFFFFSIFVYINNWRWAFLWPWLHGNTRMGLNVNVIDASCSKSPQMLNVGGYRLCTGRRRAGCMWWRLWFKFKLACDIFSHLFQDLLSAAASLFHAIRSGELSDLFEIHSAIWCFHIEHSTRVAFNRLRGAAEPADDAIRWTLY